MLFNRTIAKEVEKALISGKRQVIIIYGPKQSGKTTLINALISKMGSQKIQKYIGDDLYAQNIFSNHELSSLKRVIGNSKILIIDEAQRIENIGLTLKLLADNLPLAILTSGSASFDLANKINEPLTGRTKTFWLYPLSFQETAFNQSASSPQTFLEEILRFGMYPKVHTLKDEQERQNYLYEYLNNYLYKDILSFGNIRKPKKVIDLLSLLALQIGQEVSVAELAQNLALSQKAVLNYLDILEKMFVLINLRGFSRNLRKEISKTSKYYFVDVGLRNALIRNFNPLRLRADADELFENWFVIERIKLSQNLNHPANFYFWRTWDQKEIDLIEERNGRLFGFECKWSAKKKTSAPKEWLATYNNAEFQVVHSQNFFDLLV